MLLVMALEIEAQGLFANAGIPVLYTGIGKVNATYALTRRLMELRRLSEEMPRVVNFGTAGSHTFKTGSVVACTSFVQRDIDLTALGFPHGTTPYDSLPPMLEVPVTMPHLPHGMCSSGDSFETRGPVVSHDVLDMEAYALAKVCIQERVPFTCIKYITDGADHAAAGDWHSNLPRAAAQFLEIYRTLGDGGSG
jgi:adenosylhomocysteine nucleosidase